MDESKGSFQKGCKWLFCSNNKYGNTLYEMLMKMVEIGLLEFDEEELKIRFNQNFELIS